MPMEACLVPSHAEQYTHHQEIHQLYFHTAASYSSIILTYSSPPVANHLFPLRVYSFHLSVVLLLDVSETILRRGCRDRVRSLQ